MQPYEESIISINKKNITLELLPALRETPSLKTGAIVREVMFRSKSTIVPVRLLKLPNCFILGGKTEWLKNFKFLERYNEPEGVLIVSMLKKGVELEVRDEKENTFTLKTLGFYENYKDFGGYGIIQCNVARNVRYSMCGARIRSGLNIANSKKLWCATLIVQAYTSIGNTATGLKYTSLKYRIVDVDVTTKGNVNIF